MNGLSLAMRRIGHILLPLAVLLVSSHQGIGAEKVVSGLRVGQPAEQFLVKDCTGPAAGKTLCYYCRYANRPVVALFVREMSDEVMQLVKSIDQTVAQHKSDRLAAFVVLVGKDSPKLEQRLKQLAKKHQLRNTPLTIYRDKAVLLNEYYRIAPQASLTALVWKDRKVIANRAYPDTRLTKQQNRAFVTLVETVLKAN